MEREYAYLLHLLGCYLREEAPEPANEINWDALMTCARIHNVTGIIGYMGKKYPICQDPQRNATFRSFCLSTVALYSRRHMMAQQLIQKLEEASIDHILMKGFVLRDHYPVPELRTFSDIDLVIRPEDRAKTHALMLSLGYAVKDDWEPVYGYYRNDEYYEIHTQIMEIDVSDKADYRGYFADAWKHAVPASPHSFRFTPEFHFLYMLTHIAKHIHQCGAGIRMHLDVAAFIQRHGNALDWNWIKSQLHDLKLYDFASVLLGAAERWFGIKCAVQLAPVPEEVLDHFTEFTLEAGIFGHHNRDNALSQIKNADEDAPASRAKLLVRMAFPKAESIQARYTYLQDKPWLLPAAWVHRMIKNRSSTKKQLQNAQQIIHADTAEVSRLKRLMKDIGL